MAAYNRTMEQADNAEVEPDVTPLDPLVLRRRFTSYLSGEGIEIGPGHVPFPVPPTLSIRYVDRWEPTENSTLFPELGDTPGFLKPDVVANLDVDPSPVSPTPARTSSLLAMCSSTWQTHWPCWLTSTVCCATTDCSYC